MPTPDFNFLTDPTPCQLSQIISLYRQEGWWAKTDPDDLELVSRLILGSHCFVVAQEGKTIIGIGRAISDKASDAYIQDVTVLPEYRHRKTGSTIIKMILERLKEDNIGWIALIAEKCSHPFYEEFSFRLMPDSQPMIYVQS